jgi:hypothetical protein
MSDEAIQGGSRNPLDCFAALAMTDDGDGFRQRFMAEAPPSFRGDPKHLARNPGPMPQLETDQREIIKTMILANTLPDMPGA